MPLNRLNAVRRNVEHSDIFSSGQLSHTLYQNFVNGTLLKACPKTAKWCYRALNVNFHIQLFLTSKYTVSILTLDLLMLSFNGFHLI